MITSATGSTALLMTGLVATGNARGEGLGLAYLMAAGILTGVFQILWGYLRLAYQMRFVPLGVLSGFVNALALLIFQAQLPQLGINIHFGEAGHDHVMHALTGGQMARGLATRIAWPCHYLWSTTDHTRPSFPANSHHCNYSHQHGAKFNISRFKYSQSRRSWQTPQWSPYVQHSLWRRKQPKGFLLI